VFGSLATLAAAIAARKCRVKWLTPLFPVIINGIVVGAVLAYTLVPDAMAEMFPIFAVEVAVGELGVCYLIGLPLLLAMERLTKHKEA
jgi:NADH:ubiquinone oxidoreductase subunit K